MELEGQIMQIIVYAGNAKSVAMDSIRAAKQGDSATAKEKLLESSSNLKQAHKFHAELLQHFADNEEERITLFLMHGEDHMMAAITSLDFAKEIVAVYEQLADLKKELKQSVYLKKG